MTPNTEPANQYTLFRTPLGISPELRRYLATIAIKTHTMKEETRDTLEWGRTHLQVAKMFMADPHEDSPESTRYWAERSANTSVRLLLWKQVGRKPAKADTMAYAISLDTLPDSFYFPDFIGPASSKEQARKALDTARTLHDLARQAVAEMTGRG